MPPSLGIIADDLSGAGDTGLQFGKRGLRTVVLFERMSRVEDADVVVLDTDSRQVPAAEAAARVRLACRHLLALGVDVVYKKVDSTLRGNLGAEVEALLDELPGAGALVAPAFPANGRTVVGGRLLLRGVPLEATEFASDPLWPARSSRVADALARQSRRRVAEIGLEVVRRGYGAIAAEAEALRAAGADVCVADAETPADLAEIARAVVRAGDRWVPVGSAGLAEELPGALELGKSSELNPLAPFPDGEGGALPSAPPFPRGEGGPGGLGPGLPVLVVVGSVNPVSRRQLETLVGEAGLVAVQLDVRPLLAGGAEVAGETGRAVEAARAALLSGSDAALSLEAGGPASELLAGVGALGLEPGEASARLVSALGRVAALLLGAYPGDALPVVPQDVGRVGEGVVLAGVALTGGDTARGVCRALGAHGVVVEREVRPGIPQGRLLGGARAGMPVVTKAGGFGGPDALVEAVRFLRRVTT